MNFETKRINSAPDAIAPDGSEVRLLCGLNRGGMAVFTLPPKAVSKAIAHHTVEEVWYFISGHGRMWRRLGNHKETVDVGPGVSITVPTGTSSIPSFHVTAKVSVNARDCCSSSAKRSTSGLSLCSGMLGIRS
jgi:mannose-6-phosphate isomerase-like protein (cupin superfamily)